MIFSSIPFIFYFLPLFLLIYHGAGRRIHILLGASIAFYAWGEGAYVALLILLVAFNFAAALAIARSTGLVRRLLTATTLSVDLAVLAWFKYGQFALDNLLALANKASFPLDIRLPLGISFFTFQLIAYIVDVHRGRIIAESKFARLATYIMMFPHLVAGPIVRYQQIRGDLSAPTASVGWAHAGLQYFIVGLCQKVVIADLVAPAADHVFGLPPDQLTTPSAWLGTLAYSIQIYFDFCGYSNIAIGLAFMLGMRFPENFHYPYAAASVRDFWRRWHMSLSLWFRDYLYRPLGGNRKGRGRTLVNLLAVFLLTGLWHGASWNFVIWGAFHGFFMIVERVGLERWLAALPRFLAHAYVILVVAAGWVIFRCASPAHAGAMFQALAGGGAPTQWPPEPAWMNVEIAVAMMVGGILSFPAWPWLMGLAGATRIPGAAPADPEWDTASQVHRIPASLLLAGLILCTALIASSKLQPFLYFRF